MIFFFCKWSTVDRLCFPYIKYTLLSQGEFGTAPSNFGTHNFFVVKIIAARGFQLTSSFSPRIFMRFWKDFTPIFIFFNSLRPSTQMRKFWQMCSIQKNTSTSLASSRFLQVQLVRFILFRSPWFITVIKTITLLALVRYEIIIANTRPRASLAI